MLSLQSYRDAAFDDWHVRLLQDVAAHVSLALANADHFAQAQSERARLEALHVLEMGVAGASDESQIADAVFAAVSDYADASHMVLAYLDAAGNVVGFNGDRGGSAIPFGPIPIEDEPSFRSLIEGAGSVVESIAGDAASVNGDGGTAPSHVVWVPVMQGERVVAGIAAERKDGGRFPPSHLKLLEADRASGRHCAADDAPTSRERAGSGPVGAYPGACRAGRPRADERGRQHRGPGADDARVHRRRVLGVRH